MISPRSLRRSPPRRPLHEKSDSEANERASRLIEEPLESIYTITPYPTRPSHILSPKHGSRSRPVPKVSEDGEGISLQDQRPSHDIYDFGVPHDKKRKDLMYPQDVENHYGHSVLPLSISDTQPIAVPPLNFSPPAYPVSTTGRMDETINEEIEPRNRDAITLLSSVSALADPEEPRALGQGHLDGTASDLSLSSVESTGTIVRHKVRPSRGSYSAFPAVGRPSSSKSGGSPSTPPRGFPSSSDDGLSVSPLSALSATFPTPEIRLASTATISRPHRVVSDPVNFQYPIVRQPSASASRADSSSAAQNPIIQRPQRTLERNQDRWNPHLSTVPSESTEDRGSFRVWTPGPAELSTTSLEASHLSIAGQQRDPTGSTIRIVNESDDNVSNLLTPIPGSRGSAYYSILSGGSRNKRKSVPQARPTSKGSFFRDSIPGWAKWYYTRSNSALALSDGRQDLHVASSESLNVRRTRPKPNLNTQNQADRDSMVIEPAHSNGIVPLQVHAEPRQPVSQIWSPHLWQDRGDIRRRRFFKAPSLDGLAEGPFSRRNAQILLFTFGFVFPLAWFLAALLPLPPRSTVDTRDLGTEASNAHDLEKRQGFVDEARYENARWWRSLNRLMCILGVLIIIAIIALALVAVKMRN
ncbi:MAG: hypothetical protein LQ341_000408 [Variospora aurantia]|nr:MAG: hypothetical protein LQ341_000408 [Variospora aurantia]